MLPTDVDSKQTVLVVDDTPENIDLLRGVLAPLYKVIVAINGELALKLAAEHRPDIIMLDIMMPGMDGYEVCRHLKAHVDTSSIPVIFVTAMQELGDEMKGFEAGAVDYISKPVQPGIVKARVRTHLQLADQQRAADELVRLRTAELVESQRAAIFMLGEAGHYNDNDTGVHIWRMAEYSSDLARAAGWSVDRAELLNLAAPMHDTGKIGIPDEILKAPRKLTKGEWEIMKTHARIGYDILSKSGSELFDLAAEIALTHHEKWDGSGYPDRLEGEQIPESSRIVAIADVYDALTMKRPYKEPWSEEKALELLESEKGKHFEPRLVDLFISIHDEILETKLRWERKEIDDKAA